VTNPSVLVIDEIGYFNMNKEEANHFFQIISKRYEKGSTILTSNLIFSKWTQVFAGDKVVTTAILDRLLHHSHIINIQGDSYRLKEKKESGIINSDLYTLKGHLVSLKLNLQIIQDKTKRWFKFQIVTFFYFLVQNFRVRLTVTEQYEETDASLRYYESKEFTDFTNTFENIMSSINRKLSNIERYSSEILSTSKQGFEDAKADRQMSRYKSEQQHEWEKRMHLREKGYN